MKPKWITNKTAEQVGEEYQLVESFWYNINFQRMKAIRLTLLITIGVVLGKLDASAQWVKDNTIEGDIIRAFAVNGSNLFAGTSGGGIYRSTNSGTTWAPVNSGLPDFAQIAAMHASGPNVLAALGSRLYVTSNNGDLWTQVTSGLPTASNFQSFINKGIKIFAVGSGVYSSTDNGITWTDVTAGIPTSPLIGSIATDGSNLFISRGSEIYISGNDGASWSLVTTTSPGGSLVVKGSNLFAASTSGVFKSSDNGASWNQVNSGLTAKVINTLFVFGPNLFAGTDDVGSVFVSTDDGTTWSASNTGLNPNTIVRTFAASGSNLFAGTWAGVAISTNNGANWTNINSGLTASTVWGIVTLNGNLYAGTSAGIFRSTDNGVTWVRKNVGLTNTNVLSIATNGTTLYVGTLGSVGGVFFSNDNGDNWTLAANNGLGGGQLNIASLAAVGSILIAGGGNFSGSIGTAGKLFRSTDNGSNWTEVLTTGAPFNQIKFVGTKIFAAQSSLPLSVSSDNGISWASSTSGLPAASSKYSLDATPTKLYVGTASGVYSSNDLGATWSGPGSSPTQARSLAVTGSNVYVGSLFTGVYFSPDNGVSWSQETFPSTRVLSMTVSGTNVFAGTQGQGIWRKALSLPPTIASFTPASGSIGTTVTITGTNFSTTPANNIVKFNGTIAVVTASTATSITTTVPVGATTGAIAVTVAGNSAITASSFTVGCVQTIVSTFDSNQDGWTAVNGVGGDPAFISSGGNPDGFIRVTDNAMGPYTYFIAPSKFLGDKSFSYGKSFRFDLQVFSSPDLLDLDGDLKISGGGLSLFTSLPSFPAVAPSWSSYSFRLDTSHPWKIGSIAGSNATESEIRQVLSNITLIQINGEYAGIFNDMGGLDNVVLEFEIPPTITSITPSSGSIGTTVVISGTNFDPIPANNIVKFNGVSAIITSSTITSLTTSVPTGATTGPIEITAGCNTVTSGSNFTVPAPVTITISPQPISTAVCDGATASFTLASSGTTNLAYQWQKISSEAASLSGLRWNIPSIADLPDGISATAIDPAPVIAVMGGVSGTTYSVTMRFRGVVETKTYLGGTTTGFWNANGTPTSTAYNIYELRISDPPGIYYLNAGVENLYCIAMDYQQTVSIKSGANVELRAFTIENAILKNKDQFGNPIIIPGISPAPSAFDGQFVQMDVVAINGVGYTDVTDGGGISGATSPTLTVNTTGNFGAADYRCKVSGDFAADIFSNAVTLTVNPLPVAPTLPNNGSSCGAGAVTLSVSGGTNGQYRWYTTSTGGTPIAGEVNSSYTTPSLSVTTTYFAALNISGCESATRTAVTATINPIPAAPSAPVNGSSCGPGSVTISVSGATNSQYRWYTTSTGGTPIAGEVNSSFITPSLSVTTTYFAALNISGCESATRTAVTATINPIPAAPSAPVNGSSCGPGSVTISVSGGTNGQYRWYTTSTGGTAIAGEVNSSYTNPSLTADTNFYAAVNNGTCESVRTLVTATINPIPSAPTASGVTICANTSATLNASGGTNGQYRWYNVSTGGTAIAGQVNASYITPSLTVNTTYFVALNISSCESTRAPVSVTVNPLPIAPTITSSKTPVNGTVLLCTENNETTTLTTSPAGFAAYVWSSGQTTPSFSTNQSGSISVRVSDANGCQIVASNVLTINSTSCKPTVATTTFNTTVGGMISQSILSLITVVGTLNPSSLRIVTQPSSGAVASIDSNGFLIVNYAGIQFAGTETVEIEVCDTNGICTRQSFTIEVAGDIIVYNALSPNGDDKNPVFYIQNIELLPETKNNKVMIYNRWGDLVFEADNYDNVSKVFRGLNNSGDALPPGTYYYKVRFASGQSEKTGFIALRK